MIAGCADDHLDENYGGDGAAPGTRDYISHWQISTYQQCPLSYFYKYMAGLPEITISASVRFGQAMDAAVEEHYRQLLTSGPPASLDELLSACPTRSAAWI